MNNVSQSVVYPSVHVIDGMHRESLLYSSPTWIWITTGLVIVCTLLAMEQYIYRSKKGCLPGPTWIVPIIGKFVDSIYPTVDKYNRQWSTGALSVSSVFHIFIVIAGSNEYARKVFTTPEYACPLLVQTALKVLMPDNWVFMVGKAHAEYRRHLNVMFTRKALGIYVTTQDAITRQHFADWLARGEKTPSASTILFPVRSLNMEASLRVFCGRNIPSHAVQEINDKYWLITIALQLVSFPFPLPGTRMYNAIQARKIAYKWLELAAKNAKIRMAEGGVPDCMLETWIHDMNDPEYKGRRDFNNRDIAISLLSFLFASQDAMSSGLVYGFQHLVDNPEMLVKVREEQLRVRGGDWSKLLRIDMVDEMKYLRMFVKESLRVKPPVVLVPYTCTKTWKISDDYTVPKGTLLAPSIYPSCHDPLVYPSPEKVDPERWMDPNGLANANSRSYLVFGTGPHKCIGAEYAQLHIVIALANAAVLMDWKHQVTAKSNEVQIISTLYPADECLMRFTRRA